MSGKGKHIPPKIMERYVANELSDEESVVIDEHFAQCLECTKEIRTMRHLNFAFNQWTAEAHGDVFAVPMWQRIKKGIWKLSSEIIVRIDKDMATLTSVIQPGINAYQLAPDAISRNEIPRPEGKLSREKIQILEVPDIARDYQMKLIFSTGPGGAPNLSVVLKEQKTQKGISGARISLCDEENNLLEGGTTSEAGSWTFFLDKSRYYVVIFHEGKRWQIPFGIK